MHLSVTKVLSIRVNALVQRDRDNMQPPIGLMLSWNAGSYINCILKELVGKGSESYFLVLLHSDVNQP